MESLLEAVRQTLFSADVWRVMLLSALFGTLVGMVPGLTASMAIALFVPIAFWLSPVAAVTGIVTIVAGAIFSGDIPSVMVRIPGTPASAAYAHEAYALGRTRGTTHMLVMMLVFSLVGGLLSTGVLIGFAPQLARVATKFSVAEYFWLYLGGVSCAVLIGGRSPLKAGIAVMIGLLLSMIGLSAVHGVTRLTFGRPELAQGINFVPSMIGLFGLSGVMNNLFNRGVGPPPGSDKAGADWPAVFRLLWDRKVDVLRSSAIGTAIGVLPGAGADVAAYTAAAASGKGQRNAGLSPDDRNMLMVADATTSNNAALAGAWIPALVLGIPGDSITAIALGVLLMKNVTPGPNIFVDQPILIYGIYIAFLVSNLIMLPVGLIAIRVAKQVMRVPLNVLMPVIGIFCVVGSYSINGSYFDVGVMAVMGAVGFAFDRLEVPLAPVVLGIILGGPLEERFIQTWTGSNGNLLGFVDRPGSFVLAVVLVGLWGYAAVRALQSQRRAVMAPDTPDMPAP